MRPGLLILSFVGACGLGWVAGGSARATEKTFQPDQDGFIRDWLMLTPVLYDPMGPVGKIEVDQNQLPHEATLRPRAGDKAKMLDTELTWTVVKSPQDRLDLHAYSKAKDSMGMVGYAVVYVVAAEEMKDLKLKIGSSDHLRTYLNGKLVAYWNSQRHYTPDETEAVVSLKKGVNPLVFKVINAEEDWAVGARFMDAHDVPIKTLQVSTSYELASKGEGLSPTDGMGFIRDWLVLAPAAIKFPPFATGQIDKRQLPNEATMQPRPNEMFWYHGREVVWNRFSSSTSVIDFARYADQFKDLLGVHLFKDKNIFNALTYAVAYIDAPTAMTDLTLKMGVNDSGKVYLNGKDVVKWDKPGALEKDKVSARVSLKKGPNLLIFKALNAANNWQGCVRLLDKEGKPVRNYLIRQAPPPHLPAH